MEYTFWIIHITQYKKYKEFGGEVWRPRILSNIFTKNGKLGFHFNKSLKGTFRIFGLLTKNDTVILTARVVGH